MAKNGTYGVTAFLDILGFGDRVQCAEPDAIKSILLDVKTIQREFEYKTADADLKTVHKMYKKTVLAFSDCVVVNVPLESDITRLQGSFDAVMSELDGFGTAQARCVNEGLFLRGGVDIGWWYQRGATLVSQSMVRAYKREDSAIVPVIALTQGLYEFLAGHEERLHYSKDTEPVGRFIRHFFDEESGTEFWFLDYISMFAEDIDWMTSITQRNRFLDAKSDEKDEIMASGFATNRARWFHHHAEKITQAHAAARSPRVKKKYAWLASYHNEIAPRFTSDPGTLCSFD